MSGRTEDAPPLEWRFSKSFGDRAAGEEVQDGIPLNLADFVVFSF